jgi:GTPase SAR1 family protein
VLLARDVHGDIPFGVDAVYRARYQAWRGVDGQMQHRGLNRRLPDHGDVPLSNRCSMRSVKVVLVGDAKVGKSCILARFVQETFDRNMLATIGTAFLAKVTVTSDGPVRLQLWNTAGQEKF